MILFSKQLTLWLSSLAAIISFVLTVINSYVQFKNFHSIRYDDNIFIINNSLNNGLKTFGISLVISYPILYWIEQRMVEEFQKKTTIITATVIPKTVVPSEIKTITSKTKKITKGII